MMHESQLHFEGPPDAQRVGLLAPWQLQRRSHPVYSHQADASSAIACLKPGRQGAQPMPAKPPHSSARCSFERKAASDATSQFKVCWCLNGHSALNTPAPHLAAVGWKAAARTLSAAGCASAAAAAPYVRNKGLPPHKMRIAADLTLEQSAERQSWTCHELGRA